MVDAYAAAVSGGVGIALACAADGAARHGEFARAAVYAVIHAAAADGCGVAGNSAACHFEDSGVIYAAAPAVTAVWTCYCVACYAAAVHVEGALVVHTAAPAAVRLAHGVVGDAAAVHIQGAVVVVIHAAAGIITVGVATVGDAAAVYIECAVVVYADIIARGDFALACAVGDGEGFISFDNDGISNRGGNAVSVKAEDNPTGGTPRAVDFHIGRQIVVARLHSICKRGNTRPAFGRGVTAGAAARCAADAVVAMLIRAVEGEVGGQGGCICCKARVLTVRRGGGIVRGLGRRGALDRLGCCLRRGRFLDRLNGRLDTQLLALGKRRDGDQARRHAQGEQDGQKAFSHFPLPP